MVNEDAGDDDDVVVLPTPPKQETVEIIIPDTDTFTAECTLFEGDIDCGHHPYYKPDLPPSCGEIADPNDAAKMKRLFKPSVSIGTAEGKLYVTVKLRTCFDPAPPLFEVHVRLYVFEQPLDKVHIFTDWKQLGNDRYTKQTRVDFWISEIKRNMRYHLIAVTMYENERSEFSCCKQLDVT